MKCMASDAAAAAIGKLGARSDLGVRMCWVGSGWAVHCLSSWWAWDILGTAAIHMQT